MSQGDRKLRARIMYLLDYKPLTGTFVWKRAPNCHAELLGCVAGSISRCRNRAYMNIKVDGKTYRAHRLAWLWVRGTVPPMLDHINGDSLDNRIANLRPATPVINAQNHTRKSNGSGLPVGVRHMSGRFQARIVDNGKMVYLGAFDTPKEASEAYMDARRELHDAPAVM